MESAGDRLFTSRKMFKENIAHPRLGESLLINLILFHFFESFIQNIKPPKPQNIQYLI